MLTIIGCGNPNRSDDGVGVVVARELIARFAEEERAAVRIFDAGTDGMGVMFKARGSDALIIIDASRTGAEPGSVYEVPGHELEGAPSEGFTLHGFRWDHALFAGRKIFKSEFPDDVTVFLIEADSLDFGLELSPTARAAADKVVETLTARIRGYDA